MRTISNTAIAALVVAALFWGNCFSCPQILLALQSHQPAHGCCHRTKQTTENCQTQVLRHFVKAEAGVEPAAAPIGAAVVVVPVGLPQGPRLSASIPAEYAPPDLLSLQSNFRL